MKQLIDVIKLDNMKMMRGDSIKKISADLID